MSVGEPLFVRCRCVCVGFGHFWELPGYLKMKWRTRRTDLRRSFVVLTRQITSIYQPFATWGLEERFCVYSRRVSPRFKQVATSYHRSYPSPLADLVVYECLRTPHSPVPFSRFSVRDASSFFVTVENKWQTPSHFYRWSSFSPIHTKGRTIRIESTFLLPVLPTLTTRAPWLPHLTPSFSLAF